MDHGFYQISDPEQFLAWYQGLDASQSQALYQELKDKLSQQLPYFQRDECGRWEHALADVLRVTVWSNEDMSKFPPSRLLKLKEEAIRRFRRLIHYQDDLKQSLRIDVLKDIGGLLWVGNPSSCFFIPYPEQFGAYTPPAEYGDYTLPQVRAQLAGGREETALFPAAMPDSVTGNQLKSELSHLDSLLEEMEAGLETVRQNATTELAELQRKIEAMKQELMEKKEALMAELNEKKATLEAQKKQMERQIYLLDSQIYSILCYMGETVSFGKIMSGKNAPDTEPVVLHQKLRFLDEDLGRLASLYSIQWSELSEFERFLQNSPLALDTFAPNPRCISLVRLSRTGKLIAKDDTPYSNLLEDYDYYHGQTVGIIIRNGENLYIGWTDEDRVHIDDDLILGKMVTEVTPYEEDSRYRSEFDRRIEAERQEREAARIVDGLFSRNFIYNILQGIVDHSNILPLPAGTKLSSQSEYVLYSVADRWLTDNRFGSFNDIIDLTNKEVRRGDVVLVTQSLTALEKDGWSSHVYGTGSWENPRGRGDRNRVRNASVQDCTLHPVNLVEEGITEHQVEYLDSTLPGKSPIHFTCDASSWPRIQEMHPEAKFLNAYDIVHHHVYISVKMKETTKWEATNARVNFELMDGEYLNLTYLNSVWLEWVINTKSLGHWCVNGHPVNYAFGIRYLKTALEHIRQREITEREFLDAVDPSICMDPDWPLHLSQWKMEKGVHKMSLYQAQRFAKFIKSNDRM